MPTTSGSESNKGLWVHRPFLDIASYPAAIEERMLYAALDEGSVSSTSAYVTACLNAIRTLECACCGLTVLRISSKLLRLWTSCFPPSVTVALSCTTFTHVQYSCRKPPATWWETTYWFVSNLSLWIIELTAIPTLPKITAWRMQQ